jgi:hypothetical protein
MARVKEHARFLADFVVTANEPNGSVLRTCNQIGTKFRKEVCDENGIGGFGEYCGDNDAHHGRIYVFYLEPGVIGAVTLSRRSAHSSAQAEHGQPREP